MLKLRQLTLVFSLSVVFGSSVTLGQAVCTGVPAWDAFALYLAANHDRVVSDGRLFEAVVDSRNARPTPGGNTWWRDLGACGGTGPAGVQIVGAWVAGVNRAAVSGSNRALVFTAHVEHAGPSLTLNSVTYGGRPMTKIIERIATSAGTNAYTAAFILNESGISLASNGSFAPVWSATPGQPPAFSSVFLVNVNQAAPLGASASMAATTATAATASLTTTSGDLVIVAATAGNSGSFTLNNGFTEALELTPGSADGVAGSKSATGAAETPSVTHSNVNRQSVVGFVVRGGTGGANNPPVFTSNPIVKPNATINQAYSSSIAVNATDPNNDPLSFSKVSGPTWLIVSANGALSGTPLAANSGLNTFTVSVADNRGGSATAGLNITVQAGTPTPTPSPTPNPNCNLPRRAIVGYWQNFSNNSTFFRLSQVSSNFDVINLSFAIPTTNTDMRMTFVPESRLYANNQDFVNDVNLLHGAGKKVVMSIGGATGAIDLTTNQQRIDFTNSMIDMVRTFNLDGIDIDFEGSAFLRNPNDNNFQNPTTPRIVNAIRAIRDIRNAFPGRCFILSFAPETFGLQAGFDSYDSPGFTTRGGYIPVIHALRDITTFVMTQDYNTGSVFGLDNNIYENGAASSDSQRSDFHVAMSEMLLRGFPVHRDPARFFPALREDQVVIGLPAAPQAAGSGFTPVIPVQNAVRYLVQRVSYPGRLYTLQKPTGAYPNFRGLMTWSVNWDAANNFDFSTRHRSFLNGLP